jgi:hypothetical protein
MAIGMTGDSGLGGGAGYGGLHVEDNLASEVTSTTPTKMTSFNMLFPSSGMVSSIATNDITVSAAGDYLIAAQFSFFGTIHETYILEVYVNGSPAGIKCDRKLGNGGDIGSASLVGILSLNENDSVSLYHYVIGSGVSINFQNSQFTLVRLS